MRAFRTVFIAFAAAILACAPDRGPTAVAPPATNAARGAWWNRLARLAQCLPQPEFRVRRTIGPRGGIIAAGRHMLYVPEGALEEPVTITATVPSDTVNVVRFQPHGLTFAVPARLRMTYWNCPVSENGTRRIAYTTDDLQVLEYLPSRDNPWLKLVSADLHHFSGYAISW